MASTRISNIKGPKGDTGAPSTFPGPQGPPGLPGTNGVPTDSAVATYLTTDGAATKTAFVGQIASSLAVVRARTFYRGNRLGSLGDSITWGYSQVGAGSGSRNPWPAAAAAKSKGRLRRVVNAGTSDNKTNQMLARITTDVLSKGVDLVTIMGGINDILEGVITLAQTKANLAAMYDACIAVGVRPVPMTVLANTPATTAKRAAIVDLNTWIKEYGAAHFLDVIDLYPASLDEVTGGMKASWTTDGTHPDLAYAQIGQLVADALYPNLPPNPFPTPAADTTRRNLLTNALFTVDTNADGIPDGFTGTLGAAGEFTHSLVTPANGSDVLGRWAKITTTAANASRRMDVNYADNNATSKAFASVGDRLCYGARFDFNPGVDNTGGASVYMQVNGATVDAALAGISKPLSGVAYGEFVLPAGWNGRLTFVLTTGAGSGEFSIAEPFIENLSRRAA